MPMHAMTGKYLLDCSTKCSVPTTGEPVGKPVARKSQLVERHGRARFCARPVKIAAKALEKVLVTSGGVQGSDLSGTNRNAAGSTPAEAGA